MKKFLLAATVGISVILPGFALAATSNADVTLTSSVSFSVNSIALSVSSTGTIASTSVSSTALSILLGPGSTISVTAPGRNQLTFSGESGYLTDKICNDTTSSFTLLAASGTATTTVTVTPSTTLCSSSQSTGSGGGGISTGSSGGGGGGGGGGSPVTIVPTTTTTPAPTTTSGLIAALQAQLNALLAQIAALTGGTAGGTVGSFTRDLQVGSTGNDAKSLQMYLNSHGFPVASSGAGSPGNETTKFGGLTKAALAKWQKSVGISPAVGYFGPKTRAYIAAHP